MNELMLRRCQQLIENQDCAKSVYQWENRSMHLCCASIYAAKDLTADASTLQFCKDLLKQRVSTFSSFRGTGDCAVATLLAVSGKPEETLTNGLAAYELLRKEFFCSAYLPLAAMVIAQIAKPGQYAEYASRTRAIYKLMQAEHPMLTGPEDSAFCALLALSDKTNEELIADMESCYEILKPRFRFSTDAVQSLSHALTLCEGSPDDKCGRTIALFDQLRAAGFKYGTERELPVLGVLASSRPDVNATVTEMAEIDAWLAQQKGFGFFGSITKRQRLMYAAILANHTNAAAVQTASIGSTIAAIAAENAALMCATIAASSAAIYSSHSHTNS